MPPATASPPIPAAPHAVTRARWIAVPALGGLALALWDPARNGGPPLCPYSLVTGHSCPGCGLTRAIGALLRGRVHEAVTLHPLAPAVAALVIVGLLVGRRDPDRLRRVVQSPAGYALGALLVVAFVATWAARVSTGQIDVLR